MAVAVENWVAMVGGSMCAGNCCSKRFERWSAVRGGGRPDKSGTAVKVSDYWRAFVDGRVNFGEMTAATAVSRPGSNQCQYGRATVALDGRAVRSDMRLFGSINVAANWSQRDDER